MEIIKKEEKEEIIVLYYLYIWFRGLEKAYSSDYSPGCYVICVEAISAMLVIDKVEHFLKFSEHRRLKCQQYCETIIT